MKKYLKMKKMDREIIAYTRPVCDIEYPVNCRKTAVQSLDGIWVCQYHLDNPTKALEMLVRDIRPVKITWEKT